MSLVISQNSPLGNNVRIHMRSQERADLILLKIKTEQEVGW